MFGLGKKSKGVSIPAEDWATYQQVMAKYDSWENRELFLKRHDGMHPRRQNEEYRKQLLYACNIYGEVPGGLVPFLIARVPPLWRDEGYPYGWVPRLPRRS